MDIALMHYNFDQLATGVDQLKTRSFKKNEKDEYLNMAIIDLVNERAVTTEQLQEVVDELSPITKSELLPKLSDYTYLIPSDYFRALRLSVDVCGKPLSATYTQQDDLSYALGNPMYAPNVRWGNIPYTREGNIFTLYSDGTVLGDVTLTYIRYPAIVSIGGYNDINGVLKQTVQCDLPDNLHNEVIRRAVNIAHSSIGNSQHYQVSQNEIVKNK